MTYSLAHIVVQFLEALSTVRTQRAEDEELLDLCKRGEARGSAKFRTACLNAHSDLASPVFMKAFVFAVNSAFEDFSSNVLSPSRIGVLALFMLTSVFTPILPFVRCLFGEHASPVTPAPMHGIHYVSYVDDDVPQERRRPSIRSRWQGALNCVRKPLAELTYSSGDEEEPAVGRKDVEFPNFSIPSTRKKKLL